MSDTHNIIEKNKPGLLIWLKSFAVEEAEQIHIIFIWPQGPSVKSPTHPRALESDEKGFVHTERSDTSNIIAKNKPGLLIRIKYFAMEAA